MAVRIGTILLCGLAVVLGQVGKSLADTILVPEDFSTIQEAIDAAVDGDEIVVAPGEYQGSINTLGKAIHLRSSGGPDVTTITADPRSSVVTCADFEGPDTIIEGFRISGGTGTFYPPPFEDDSIGGGMHILGADPTIIDCVFINNSATVYAGGIANIQGDPTLIDCSFIDNSAPDGGGMVNFFRAFPTLINCTFRGNLATGAYGEGGAMLNGEGAVTIVGCTFIENEASEIGGAIGGGEDAVITGCYFEGNIAWEFRGGAIYGVSGIIRDCVFQGNDAFAGGAVSVRGAQDTEIAQCLFRSNTAEKGGALSIAEATPTISNCTLVDNAARRGNAIVSDNNNGGHSTIWIRNCILRNGGDEIWNNDASIITVSYSNVQDGYEGDGNIDADPLFADADGGDYRLNSGSPCIDAADNDAVPADLYDLDEDDDTREPVPFDLGGDSRFVDDPSTEDTGRCLFHCELPMVDMGAYEFQAFGGCVREPQWICDGDVDGDGQVNPVDAGLVQAAFGSIEEDDVCQYDMDCDGQVNPVDSGIVQSLFGTCEEPRAACP